MSIEKFGNYLQSKGYVSVRHIPYYVRWVDRFLQFCQSHTQASTPDEQLAFFLAAISKKCEQWQVDQAGEAVTLYQFFNQLNRKSVPKHPEWNASWVTAAEMMKRMLRLKQLSFRTEQSYISWLRAFYAYVRPQRPVDLTDRHLKDFLSYLAAERQVAKATQNLAFNALLFFYRHVLEKEVGSIAQVVRSKRGRRLPTVLTKDDVLRLLHSLEGVYGLMARIIYGGGLRLNECVRLRIKDIEFAKNTLMIRGAKGDKDRQTLLPENVQPALRNHIHQVQKLFAADRQSDMAGVHLPGALSRKYPNADKQWIW